MEEPEAMDTDFETSSVDEAETMEIDEAPPPRDWRTQYLDWMIRCASARYSMNSVPHCHLHQRFYMILVL